MYWQYSVCISVNSMPILFVLKNWFDMFIFFSEREKLWQPSGKWMMRIRANWLLLKHSADYKSIRHFHRPSNKNFRAWPIVSIFKHFVDWSKDSISMLLSQNLNDFQWLIFWCIHIYFNIVVMILPSIEVLSIQWIKAHIFGGGFLCTSIQRSGLFSSSSTI